MTKYDQILTKYDQILTKYAQNGQMHVENFQGRNFLETKKSNAKNHTGLGWEGGIGVLLIALLIANALTQPPYSTPLLKGVTQGSRGMSFNKLL